MDGLWTGSAEIAWEEARDGRAVPKVRIRWTRLELEAVEVRLKGMIRWTGGGRAVDGLEV